MLSNLIDRGEPLSSAVGNHLYVLYCFTSCPPLVGHINQTAMGGILIRVLINLTAIFTDQPFALSWRWTSPQFHLSSLLHLANHRDVAQSLAGSDTWGYVCMMCVLDASSSCCFFVCVLYAEMPIFCSAQCWFEHVLYPICSCALLICLFFYSPIFNIFYVLVLNLVCSYSSMFISTIKCLCALTLPWNARILTCCSSAHLLCWYSHLLVCSLAHLLACSYAQMFICSEDLLWWCAHMDSCWYADMHISWNALEMCLYWSMLMCWCADVLICSGDML